MKISIVIPNFNGKEIMKRFLPKLLQLVPVYEVIVVDDVSTDGSRDMLEKDFPKIKVVEKVKREGFASSVNLGVENAKGDLILLLNHDVCPENNLLEYLIPYFDDDKVFAVGCLEKNQEKKGQILRGRGVGIFCQGFLQHKRGSVDKINTLWVSGGSALFRKSIWLKLGGMLSIYNPFYWEDIDLSYRALKSGYKIYFEPKSIVWHYHDDGVIRREYDNQEIITTAYRNQILFVWINITDNNYLIRHVLNLPVHLVKSILTERLLINGLIRALAKLGQVLKLRNDNHKRFKLRDNQLLDIFKSDYSS